MLCVVSPGEVLADVSAEEFEGLHSLHPSPVDVQWGVVVSPLLQVTKHLLSLLSI